MNKLTLLVILAAVNLSACAAEETFTITDYLHHTWTNEFVSYQIDASKVPVSPVLIGPGGKAVPVQITELPGGKAEVAFIVAELPADGELTYTLTAGKSEPTRFDPARAVDPVSGMSITADTVFSEGTFTLAAGITIDADNVTVTGAG